MRTISKEVKSNARTILLRYGYGTVIMMVVIYYFLQYIASSIINFAISTDTTVSSFIFNNLVNLVVSFMLSLLSIGFYKMALAVSRNEHIYIRDLFYGFRHTADSFLIVIIILDVIQMFCVQLPGALWSRFNAAPLAAAANQESLPDMLDSLAQMSYISLISGLIQLIGGLIYQAVTVSFAMAYFLMIDHPDMAPIQAIKESFALMRGHRKQYYFITALSFIGYHLLDSLGGGIAMVLVLPYIMVVKTLMYRSIAHAQ